MKRHFVANTPLIAVMVAFGKRQYFIAPVLSLDVSACSSSVTNGFIRGEGKKKTIF